MSGLPKGWVEAELDGLFAPLADGRTIHHGWSPQCESEPSGADEWGVLKTTAVQGGAFLAEHNKRLPPHLTPRPELEVRDGDLLITSAGPRARCGVACFVRQTRPRLMLSGKMYRFRVDERFVDPRYIEAYLQSTSAARALDAMKTGISDSGVNLTHGRFRRLTVPLAPTLEQRRIVAALEKHLSHLDAAERAVHDVVARLDVMRRSVLETAVAEGREAELGELLARIEAGRSAGGPAPPARENEWGVIKVSAMTWGEFRSWENKRVGADSVDPRHEIRPGDLLVSRANTTEYVGAAVLVRDTRPHLLLSDKSLRLVTRDGVSAEWLLYALLAPATRRQISALASGTSDSMRNVSQEKLRAVRLRVPDPKWQLEIAADVGQHLAAVANLAGIAEKSLRKVAALRRSILAQAFRGQLVPQHPDDAPASTILSRIAAERAATPTLARRRRERTLA